MPKTIILLPTYNERENVSRLVPELFALYPDIRVLVIDDNSPDGTGEAVRAMMVHNPGIKLLSRPRKEGLGEAYKAGMLQAIQYEDVTKIITMDADGSHAPEYVRSLLQASSDADLVIGSRYVEGGGIENWERWRFALSRYGNLYARTVTGMPVRDITAGFMCFSADVIRSMDLTHMQASGYAFLMELKFFVAVTTRGTVREVPIIFKSRWEGESKISRHIIREGLKTPWRLRLQQMQRRAGRFGFLFEARFLQVIGVGAVGFVLQTAVFELLGFYLGLMRPSTAIVVGGELAIVSNFMLNARFSFSDRNDNTTHFIVRLMRFHAVALISVCLQWILVRGAENLGGSHWVLWAAYFSGIALGLISSYVGYYFWVWRK